MDKEPFIVKSGKGHSIEVEQGSSNARSKRTYVAPQDEAREDQVVSEGQTQERRQLDLSKEGVEQTLGTQDQKLQAEEAPLPEPEHAQHASAGDPVDAAGGGVPEDLASAAGAAGPVLVQEVQGDEDARADKAGVGADRFVSGQDEGAPEPEIVAVPEPEPLTNRQKIEQLQASANRILVEQTEVQPAELEIEKHDDPEAQLVVQAQDGDALPVAAQTAIEPAVVVVAPVEELPAELAGNLGFAPPVEDPAQSAFLARVRALRNNMSVTDDRLTKLQSKPPVKP